MPDGSDAIVVRFSIEPQWHMYWTNPGDSGAATHVIAALPAGWTGGAPQLPRPQILGTADERTYGYEKTFDVLVPVVSPEGDEPPSILVRIRADWMVCRERCQVGKASLSMQVSTDAVPYSPEYQRSFPTKLPASVRAVMEDARGERALRLTFPSAAIPQRPLRFIPDAVEGLEWTEGTGPFFAAESGREMTLRLPFKRSGDAAPVQPRLRGLLLAGDRDGDPAYQADFLSVDVPLADR
jgi:thiol:disulfide interchange protein DsbD